MKIREIATGLQFPEGPVAMDDGSVVLVEDLHGKGHVTEHEPGDQHVLVLPTDPPEH